MSIQRKIFLFEGALEEETFSEFNWMVIFSGLRMSREMAKETLDKIEFHNFDRD